MTRPQGDSADVTAVFGRQVHARRTARGWSLRRMAPMAGLRHAALHRIETGEGTTLATAGRIAAALGVPLAVLVTETACSHCQECGAPGPAVTG